MTNLKPGTPVFYFRRLPGKSAFNMQRFKGVIQKLEKKYVFVKYSEAGKTKVGRTIEENVEVRR